MKKYIIYSMSFFCLIGLFFAFIVSLKQKQISNSYPRFDGWECLNTPSLSFQDKTWQITLHPIYEPDNISEITLRNKYGQTNEEYTVHVRVIDPTGVNFYKDIILLSDKSLSAKFPVDFAETTDKSILTPGLYTYTFEIGGKFILCYGFYVREQNFTYFTADKHLILKANPYGLQYLPNFKVSASCNSITIAGKVHGFAIVDSGVNGVEVRLQGNGIDLSAFTTNHQIYGKGTYEFVVSNPIDGDVYYLSAFNNNTFKRGNNDQISETIPIIMRKNCAENFIWVNFQQIGLLE